MRQGLLLLGLSAALGFGAIGCNGSSGCNPACGEFLECCDGTCAQLATDSNHCGACGNACGPGQMCQGSTCVAMVDAGAPSMCRATCAANQQCCGSACVDRFVEPETNGRLSSSFDHCGACGQACDINRSSACSIPGGGTTGIARCSCGVNAECAEGLLCVPNGTSFTCIDTDTDENNCGGVGVTCIDDEQCVDGVCQCPGEGARCGAGTSCCGGSCISTTDDPTNCGGCGTVCTPNAPDCSGGSCTCAEAGRECTAPTEGIFGFGGDPGESCCPGMGCVANTDSNCACVACEDDLTCQVAGSGIFNPGGGGEEVTVCCGDEFTPLAGCGGFSLPGLDGGIFPSLDGGVFPGFDGGVIPSDAGGAATDAGPMDAGIDAGPTVFDAGP